jgi:hypothetical protein
VTSCACCVEQRPSRLRGSCGSHRRSTTRTCETRDDPAEWRVCGAVSLSRPRWTAAGSRPLCVRGGDGSVDGKAGQAMAVGCIRGRVGWRERTRGVTGEAPRENRRRTRAVCVTGERQCTVRGRAMTRQGTLVIRGWQHGVKIAGRQVTHLDGNWAAAPQGPAE